MITRVRLCYDTGGGIISQHCNNGVSGGVYRSGSCGIFGGSTELIEVSGSGVEFAPNHTEVFGRVLRPYRTTSAG